eukprot:s1087_g24.t1
MHQIQGDHWATHFCMDGVVDTKGITQANLFENRTESSGSTCLAADEAEGALQECCCSPWALPQPGSAHTCRPRGHFCPGCASLHPVVILYGQQILSPEGVWSAFPINSFGTFGPRPRRLPLPLPLPLPLVEPGVLVAAGAGSESWPNFLLLGFALGCADRDEAA